MHAYFITRGIINDVDRLITQLQGKYLRTTHNMYKTGQPAVPVDVQFSVRPIQLWEMVFPEPHRDLVLNTLLQGNTGETQHKKHQKFIWGMQKVLGVKPIPKDYKKTDIMPLHLQNVEVVGIGIKEDYYTDNMTGERYYNATPEQKAKSSEGI